MITTINIAISDHHPITRKGLRNLLTDHGYNIVVECNDASHLISDIANTVLLPDICILDSGYEDEHLETLRDLHARWPSIRALIFTDRLHEYSMIKMISSGVCGFLLKTAHVNDICSAVQEIFRFGYYFSDVEVNNIFCQRKTEVLKKGFLNNTEVDFIKHCCSELTYKEIAWKMNINARNIESYREELFSKLSVKSRVGLVMFAFRNGVIS